MNLESKPKKKLITDIEQIMMLNHPLKMEILQHLSEGRSSSEVAKLIGEPPQKVNYHMKKLERVGLIKKSGHRNVRNLVEVLYETVAEQFVLSDDSTINNDLIQQMKDQGSLKYLFEMSEQMKQDTMDLMNIVDESNHIPSATLDFKIRLSNEQQRKQFIDEYVKMMNELVSKYNSIEEDASEVFKAMIALYPHIKKGDEQK
ncbi:winged helix-turn-helix domain-containing protein [Chengkuizengella axinellae]|uniref:Helix-turn-helix domain-containing protein n=1 Tax=Chengkuizengella axinellae TaxID=3064388 RepID=A0ABT9J1A4_9BACL|nr:helix-turn-helix domain-containing protein [Chengkuizengella sp. 2205SS18-9]MDP5275395.1 helix-turn-helix domain-containing protein [Chengkuizengella sp. 2205SS18-9]